jgi:hypothetical protein
MALENLLTRGEWLMLPGERAALEGILSFVAPTLSIEIGTHTGGSLGLISAYSRSVHAFDLERHATVTPERFPNVTFHIGDSHELLPAVLAELSEAGTNVDFVLVDGDHHADGVRRDIEDLLSARCTSRSVILLHDTLNGSVRSGIRQVDFGRFEKVRYVDLDFVTGRVMTEGPEQDELWYGLGVVVVGHEVDIGPWPSAYDASTAYRALSRALEQEGQLDEPIGYGQYVELQGDVAELSRVIDGMQRSLSWKVTAPLRTLRAALHRSRTD